MHIVGEKSGFGADMGDIVELSDNVVPVVGTGEAMCLVNLGTEMAKKKNSRLVWPKQDRANEHFEVLHHLIVPIPALVVAEEEDR
jgi:hypothetical protein